MSAVGAEDEEPAKGSGLPRLCGPFWKFPGPGCAGLGARLFHHPDVTCEGKGGEAEGHLLVVSSVHLPLSVGRRRQGAPVKRVSGCGWEFGLCYQMDLDLEY